MFGWTLGIVPHLTAAVHRHRGAATRQRCRVRVLKFLGVGYLLYMAWASWRDRTPLVVDEKPRQKSGWRVIASAILLNGDLARRSSAFSFFRAPISSSAVVPLR